jgi:acyl-homoserine lactone acylase PvdQ
MTTIPKAFEAMDADSKLAGGYRGVTVNVVMADSEGNIGYQLLAPVPIRKDKTPFFGLRVHDGRTSAWDWEEDGVQTVPLSDLPRSLNPSKGFIVSCNNK